MILARIKAVLRKGLAILLMALLALCITWMIDRWRAQTGLGPRWR